MHFSRNGNRIGTSSLNFLKMNGIGIWIKALYQVMKNMMNTAMK